MNNRGGEGGEMKGVVEFLVSGNMCIEERSNVVIWFFFFPLLFSSFFFFSKSKYAKLNERGRKKIGEAKREFATRPTFPANV